MASDAPTDYAQRVAAGGIVAGPLVRAACARHLDDLEKGAARGLRWDAEAAARGIRFFPDVLRLSEGQYAGQRFVLQPHQAFKVGALLGWKRDDGTRRFRTGYIEEAKGNGKSPLAAGIGLYMLAADGEAGAECYAAAVTREQAGILFRDAVHMVEYSPALRDRITRSGKNHVYNLAHLATGSFFRPISSEGRALDGKRVHYAALDEVHEHPDSLVVDKMRAGTKGRRQALILEITNSGYDRQSVCYAHHDYSRRVVTREIEDDSWFAYVCCLDPDDNPLEDRSCWIKANPNLGISITERYLEEQVREARGMPSKESLVRRLNFCQWTDAANPWINQDKWRYCEADFDLAELNGADCYGGLDLSGKNDLTALALAFPDDDGWVDLVTWFWTPADALLERERIDHTPYSQWVREGYLEATPGPSVNYEFVATRIAELAARFNIRVLAFDPYRIGDFERAMEHVGLSLPLAPHGQGFYKAQGSGLWMPRSVECLEEKIIWKRLRVKKNPVLTHASASAVLETDAKGNRIFTKRKASGRIDGIVASAMAVGACDRRDDSADLGALIASGTAIL